MTRPDAPAPRGDDDAPGLTCSRWIGDPVTGHACGDEATWHVIWSLLTMRNGLCCDRHYLEAVPLWPIDAAHPYDPACSMPGSLFIIDENRCVPDDAVLR